VTFERSLALTSVEAFDTEIKRRQSLAFRVNADQSIEASKARSKTLAGFIRESWHIVEPNTPLIWGWHLDAICQHLEAVTYGQITRLAINVPPGTMKSLAVSVFWPAWEWGPAGLHGMRYFTSSYIEDYVIRDSRKMRDLIASEWYQQRWSAMTQLARSGETSFSNVGGGWREGVVFASMTGGRGDRVIIDDPHSVTKAESQADREKTIRIFRESVTSRLMDPVKSAIVIVMQRLHTDDVTGVALALNLGYVHLMLPMEFEPDRRCETVIGFKDPRTYPGELLFPERFTREVVERDKIAMGAYAVVGQYQQRPTLREGGLFKRAWLKITEAAAPGTRWLRYWDLAATKATVSGNPAYTAGVKLGRQPDGQWVVGHVARIRDEGVGVRTFIKATAKEDGVHVDIGYPQDPGQAGKSQAQSFAQLLVRYNARALRESGDKITRADPVRAQAEAGLLSLVRGDWNEPFIEELTNFPGGQFKDQVDALSGAFAMLIGANMFTTPEDQIAVDSSLRIPDTWPRVSAVVISKGTVSTVWGAYHPSNDIMYVYDCLVRPRTNMAVHASAVAARKTWVPMILDMFDDDRGESEGTQIVAAFNQLGVEAYHIETDMEANCMEMQQRFDESRLRVMEHLTDWFGQYRRLARDEKGQIDDAASGILRATGLLLRGVSVAVTEAKAASEASGGSRDEYQTDGSSTGY
jgi:predicted phage terminase large subunit-like protein